MCTCPEFDEVALFLDDMSGVLHVPRVSVTPGMVVSEDGMRRLVLNTWYDTTELGVRHNVMMVALSHGDSMDSPGLWTSALAVEETQRRTVRAQCPQPGNRRWWLAVTLDDQSRYQSASGFRDGAACRACTDGFADAMFTPANGCRFAAAHRAGIERRRNHRGTRVGRLGKRAAAVGLPKKCHRTARFTE